MKKLIQVLIVCGLIVVMGGTASGVEYQNADNIVKAISIEQFFGDGKDRTGEIVYVNGPVIELTYNEDPFSDKKEISALMLQKRNWKIMVILNKNLPLGTLKEGSNATVKFTTASMMNSYTFVRGEVVHGNVKIVKWSSKEKPKLEDSVTIENYFSKKIRFGNKRVTLEGTVVEFSKAGSDGVSIKLSGSDNNSVLVFIEQLWKKKEIKDILKTLKEGDRVSIRGTFFQEGGTTPIFTGTTLSIAQNSKTVVSTKKTVDCASETDSLKRLTCYDNLPENLKNNDCSSISDSLKRLSCFETEKKSDVVEEKVGGTASGETLKDAEEADKKKDYKKANKIYKFLAEKGNSEAQKRLGWKYFGGDGVSQDYKEALKWGLLSAKQDHPSAQLLLGMIYDEGKGVPQDYKEALKWYRLSQSNGMPEIGGEIARLEEKVGGTASGQTLSKE
jgi:hypothetical protein